MIGPLRDQMMVHVSTQPRPHYARLAAVADGLVLQAPMTRDAARQLARTTEPVVFQHDGKEPSGSQLSMWSPDEAWLQVQEQMKPAVVTSRTVLFGDPVSMTPKQVTLAVAEANRFRDLAFAHDHIHVAVSAAIDRRWLTRDTARRTLTSALGDIGAPVHLMLAHREDPLSSDAAVRGLVDVVQTVADVMVMRCDHGALGAYAFGASGGSIGATGGTRHFLMPGNRGAGVPDDPTPRVFLRVPLDWWRGSKLGLTNDPLFDCHCGRCHGRHLSRFQNERLLADADIHSVVTWTTVMQQLRDTPAGSAREKRWTAICQEAWDGLDDLEDRSNLLYPASKQLRAWLRLVGVKAY